MSALTVSLRYRYWPFAPRSKYTVPVYSNAGAAKQHETFPTSPR